MSAGHGWAETGQGEFGEGDQSVGGAESERAPRGQPDLGCERLLAPVCCSCPQGGRVGPTYGYAGGGRRLEEMGAIFGGSRRAQQARLDLMLALGAGMSDADLRTMFES